jgi:hypothetical protein
MRFFCENVWWGRIKALPLHSQNGNDASSESRSVLRQQIEMLEVTSRFLMAKADEITLIPTGADSIKRGKRVRVNEC